MWWWIRKALGSAPVCPIPGRPEKFLTTKSAIADDPFLPLICWGSARRIGRRETQQALTTTGALCRRTTWIWYEWHTNCGMSFIQPLLAYFNKNKLANVYIWLITCSQFTLNGNITLKFNCVYIEKIEVNINSWMTSLIIARQLIVRIYCRICSG